MFDKIASVYFIEKYINILALEWPAQEPALCQLYLYTFVPCCELSGHVKLGQLLEAVGVGFSHRPGNPATDGVLRRPSAGDSAGYRLRRP